MRVLLGSGGFRTEQRVQLLAEELRLHFGDIRRLLFVPYALADHDGYLAMLTEKGLAAGYALEGIHRCPDPSQAVREAAGIYVGGGNTFRLVHDLHRHDLLDAVRERVAAGMPYFGVSAGANVACPTLMTTNDMPIVMPPSFRTFGIVPFQINPHYFLGQSYVRQGEELVPHFGETRDDRIREFHEMNEEPVVGLWEGTVLRVTGDEVELRGGPARIFRRGREPVDVEAGSLLGKYLSDQGAGAS